MSNSHGGGGVRVLINWMKDLCVLVNVRGAILGGAVGAGIASPRGFPFLIPILDG